MIHFASGRDEHYLESVGILTRPQYNFMGDGALIIARAQVQAFLDLEQREPGQWALAQGENSFLLQNRTIEVGRGALVELHRAIPVPNKDVPLNDILEFRVKRRDELLEVRNEIDSFFSSINNAADKTFELQRNIGRIDAACANLLRIAKEWRFPLRLSDLKSSFEIRPLDALAAGAGGWVWGAQYEMPILGAALGVGGLATLKINRDFGMRRAPLRSHPYRYVYHFHRDLF